MNFLKKYWIILLILILASILRLAWLGQVPASLYWEETALGYDAYSIWKTGKDFHGNLFPVVAFESFGDYKPSGYFYLAAPFVGIFGLNNWSVRLPSALAGIVTVLLVYLLGTIWFKNKRIGLYAALVLSILPWHIQFSRAAFEVNVATMWLTMGVYFLTKTKQKNWWIVLSSLTFVFSAYTYHGLRVLAPLLASFLIIFFNRQLLKSAWFYVALTISLLLMAPLLINIRSPQVAQRFAETSLFSTSSAVEETNALRQEDNNSPLSHLIHHRYFVWGREILSGMLSHFSPQFLFTDGDTNPRHQTGYTGLLFYWCIIPLFYLFGRLKREGWLLLGWVVLATIPASLTNLTPHTLRFLPAVPAVALLIGLGLDQLITVKYAKIVVPLFALSIVVETFGFGFDYLTSYRVRSSEYWQYGYEPVIQFIKNRNKPDEFVQVTRAYGRPSMYFLYYLGVDPRQIQQESSMLLKDQGELLAFNHYSFGPIDLSKKGLAVSEKPLPQGVLIHTILFLNNQPAFYIYEI